MRYDRARKLGDGYWQLEYVEVPDWARRLSWLFDQVDHYTGHLLCGFGWPDYRLFYPLAGWFYRVGHFFLLLPDHKERVLVTSNPFEVDDPAREAALRSLGPPC